MHRNIIIITGTPGTGKTTIAIALSKRINAKLIAVNDLIKHKKLYMGYSDDGAMMAKLPELKREILREIAREKNKTVILEGHLLSDISIKGACVIVMREHLKTLLSRLKKRGYPVSKIRDNMVSEAIGYCSDSSRKHYDEVHDVMSGKNAITTVLGILTNKRQHTKSIDLSYELEYMLKKNPKYFI
ncbi:MAG: AAA family ATPase [Candidatus Marsarchaeota archaeon]|jgi:adenylate kinase|nr:AAA family ATPase [Candidatus Marsarchaeota archaeon]